MWELQKLNHSLYSLFLSFFKTNTNPIKFVKVCAGRIAAQVMGCLIFFNLLLFCLCIASDIVTSYIVCCWPLLAAKESLR